MFAHMKSGPVTMLRMALVILCVVLPAAPVLGAGFVWDVTAVPPETKAAPLLTLREALAVAERQSPSLVLVRYQLQSTRSNLTASPAATPSQAAAASLFAQSQFGLSVPASAFTAGSGPRQSQLSVEQATAQYSGVVQQIRLSTLQAYVDWQKATALVTAQRSGLERALTQQANVASSYAVGLVARYDLLQAQAQTEGQRAGLSGALASQAAAKAGLEQIMGRQLLPTATAEPMTLHTDELTPVTSLELLVARAMRHRPDLRQRVLDLADSRLGGSLAVTGSQGTLLQVQSAAVQYQMAMLQARAEVQRAFLRVQGGLEELKAREFALSPAQEALRLAELRFEAGLGTYLEVQGAFASAQQAEASRIDAAANVTLSLGLLSQSTGDL